MVGENGLSLAFTPPPQNTEIKKGRKDIENNFNLGKHSDTFRQWIQE
jgi:hypothetical protein